MLNRDDDDGEGNGGETQGGGGETADDEEDDDLPLVAMATETSTTFMSSKVRTDHKMGDEARNAR